MRPAATASPGDAARIERRASGLLPLPRIDWTRRKAAWAVVGLLAAGALAASVDIPATRLAAALPPDQVRFWRFVTDFGLSGYMFATSAGVAGVALVWRRFTADPRRRAWLAELAARAAFVFVSVAVSGLAAQTIKHLVGRLRPRFMIDHGAFAFVGPSWDHGADSFPSGHTVSAFAAAMALGLLVPRLRIPLALAAVMIGISRVATGYHFPSDVVCGAALGVGITAAVALRFARRGWVFAPPTETVPGQRP